MNFNIPNFNINLPNFKGKQPISQSLNPLSFKSQQPQNDTFELSVGYINDTHGQANNMMRILSGIKGDLRLSGGDNDIGDEKNKAVHKMTAKFLNLAKITASAFGNHELDTTQADFIDNMAMTEGTYLSANFKKNDAWEELEDNLEEYGRAGVDKELEKSKIVEVKGEKIGLVGASPQDMFDRTTHPLYHKDCKVDSLEETIEDIQEEVNDLKEKGINKIFLLSHLGYKKDQTVAQKTKGIDVIIGGHTHELIRDIKEGDNLFYSKDNEPVIITQAGKNGNYFGELNLTFDKDGVITKAQNNIAETDLFKKNLVNQYLFDEILGKPETVGYIKSAPPHPVSLIEENPHANFVCDVMREETGADIGLWHHCGVRNYFHKGVIDSSEVKDMSPFLDYVVVANVTEKNLVDTFKNAIETTFDTSDNKPGLIAVSGLTYTVNPDEGKLVDMTYIDKNGKKHSINVDNPSETKTYSVVSDEFLLSAGADFLVMAEEKDYIKQFEYDKDYIVCQYLKKQKKPVVIEDTDRIKFLSSKA